MFMVSAAASLAFNRRNYLTTQKTEVMEGGDETPQDSRIRFCVHCHKGFESSKALYGHLRIHRQAKAGLKTEILRSNSSTCERKRSQDEDEDEDEDEDDGFDCFVCNESFSSLQLLYRHTRIHGGTVSNRAHQRSATSQESNNSSLSEVETTLNLGFESTVCPSNDHDINLLKDIPGWSQTKKRGFKKIDSEDDVIYDAVPLRFCLGPEHPLLQTKKKKIEESMETQNKSRSEHGRRSMKKATAVERVHQCEICGRIFATGQALGGHKTCHREKDPWKAELVQANPKQGSCGEVIERVTRMLLPGLLPEEALLPEQAPPKKMLDFDLNTPCQENLFLF